jgi:hypothetical protein
MTTPALRRSLFRYDDSRERVGRADRTANRALAGGTQPTRRYDPTGDQAAWDRAAERIGRG